MQLAILFESFDGNDLFTRGATNLRSARTDRLPIEQHRACTALTFAATVLTARQA